jgi:DNA helicase-2/ATP-dependent DNA helicase PcrA
VLTHRVAHLIDHGVPPHAILAITFTNKAAAEMRERIGAMVGPAARDIWASTFHSACVRILRREAPEAGYPRDFSIFDADDQLRLIRRCMVEEDVDPKRVAPRAIQARISDAKSRLRDADAFASASESFSDEVVVRVYRRYADALRANAAMDFDDLLMVTAQLIEGNAAVRARWQGRFTHVLVDEYQDTNPVQFRLVRALAAPQDNVMAVGDDDQGIYSWRGADVRNILEFTRDYPSARTVALEQNYRSTGTILRAAHAVVSRNAGRLPKELWTARAVAGQVERALSRGDSLSDIAVFYRTNAQSRALEDTLIRLGIGYTVVGGPRFYERAEVRDLLAYLRAALNPADRVSLERALGSPRRGIGPGAVAKLVAHAASRDIPVGAALAEAEMIPGLQAAQRAALTEVGSLLADVRLRAEGGMPLDRVVDEVLTRSGLRDAFEREDTFEARGRLENLEEMVRAAGEYAATADGTGLAGFLEGVALQADADLVDERAGAVTLMTIHNAKGLEFETVVITGLEEGLFPHARSDSPESLDEERRLFYVGLTRAKRTLTLTHAESRATYGGRDYRLPSRFLGEIPMDTLAPSTAGGRVARPMSVSSRAAGIVRPGSERRSSPGYAMGDEVVHATFGEGIVIGVEGTGELVRVRFANDGAERRLMAGAAPMTKVGG